MTHFTIPSGAPSPFSPETDQGPTRVLVIEDDDAVRKVLVRLLASRGYAVDSANSGEAALGLLVQTCFALALCDVQMPGMSGVEVVRRAIEIDPDLSVVMLTGANDAATATATLTGGAHDYLLKPIDPPALERAIERALHRRRLMADQRRVERLVREQVAIQTEQLRGLTVGIAETLINAMEAKDLYLRGHSQRVADLAASIAEELALDADTVEHVRLAARLHDVGKIGIRESVLNKPGKLTSEEFEHVKTHVVIGMEILAPLTHLGEALTFVHQHHEHWDGSGYPLGLAGEGISIGGRILCAADAFDALTSRRAYRDPLTSEATLDHLRAEGGRLVDARVCEALGAVVARRQSLVFLDETQG